MNNGRIKRTIWTWELIGAIFGLVGGVLAGLFGGLLTASTWILGADVHPWMQSFGTALLVSTIPLLVFGGYCLDWMDREPKANVSVNNNGSARGSAAVSQINLVCAFLFILCAAPIALRAQQTIFNVPSSDVLERGKVYGELDVTFKPNDAATFNRFSSFVPRLVVGTGGRTELGINITGNIQPGADVTTLVPNVKHKLYDGGDNGFSVVVGDNVFIPTRNRDLVTYDVGNYIYGQVSRTFKSTRGARLTAGVYHFSQGVVAANAQSAGGQFGFEQPVNSRLTILADWITGKHAAGYFTPGFSFKPHPRVTGYVGYSIGNDRPGQGNNLFYTAIGVNFN